MSDERTKFIHWFMEQERTGEMLAAHVWDNNYSSAQAWRAALAAAPAQERIQALELEVRQLTTRIAELPTYAALPDGIVYTSAAQDVLEEWFEEIGLDMDVDDAKRLFDKMAAASRGKAPAQQPAPSAAPAEADGWCAHYLPCECAPEAREGCVSWRKRKPSLTPQADSQPAPVRPLLPEYLTLAVDRWFAENTGSGGCSDKDVRELAELFYGVAHAGGRESVDDALAIVESFGPGIGGLNDTYARQILLAEEVKRLRAARAQADGVTAPAGGAVPVAIKAIGYGGSTGINDYLMSDGTVKAMRPSDVKWATQAAAATPPAQVADSVLEDAARPFPAIVDGLLWLCVKEHGAIKPLDSASALPIPRSWKSSMLDAARKQGVTDCAGGSPCSTCPDKKKCAYGCVRQGGKA